VFPPGSGNLASVALLDDRETARVGSIARSLPLGLVAVLLALLVVVGLHGGVPPIDWGAHSNSHDAEAVAALEVVFIVLLLALAGVTRRGPRDELLATTLRRVLWYFLGGGAVALAAALVALTGPFNLSTRALQSKQRVTPPVAPQGLSRHLTALGAGSASHFPVLDVLYALMVCALLAAVGALWFALARNDRRPRLAEPEEPAQECAGTLREALAEGRRALAQIDGSRAAIIACYIAMENSLADAGASRGISETPDELLVRAAKSVVFSRGAAQVLTSLFYEARFSTHPLSQADKDQAEVALSMLFEELHGLSPGVEL